MNFFKETFFRLILLVDSKPSILDKIMYLIQTIGTFAPVAYLLAGLNFWFETNQQFASFVLICLAVNLVVGIIFHIKVGTFDWIDFFKKNILMWGVLIVSYGMLEMLRITAGNNYIGNGFKILIQITTLLYPISKILKNVYILSNRQFPPRFIMDKIYNFEKNGNLDDLFNDKNDEK